MTKNKQNTKLESLLEDVGLRVTQQRLLLASALFGEANNVHRHVTAEALFHEIEERGSQLSLATVYNALNQFHEAGLVNRVPVGAGRYYYDTNTDPHHHIYHVETQTLSDLPASRVQILLDGEAVQNSLPDSSVSRLEGKPVLGVDVVVRVGI